MPRFNGTPVDDQPRPRFNGTPAANDSDFAKLITGEKRGPSFEGGMAGAAALGAGDTMSFGFGDEIGAGLGAASEYLASLVTGDQPRSYSELLGAMRDQEDRAKETNPGSFLTGQIAGGLTGGVGLAKGGLSATANAIGRGAGLGRVAATSAAEGATLGSLQGFGSGEGVDGRAKSATVGLLSGLALGGTIPLVAGAVQKVGGMAAAPIAARVFPERYAERAMGEGLRRSGMTADDVANSLDAARADGQGMFTVADAMGNSGQRMLSTVTRTPNDARQGVVESLLGRQMDQGRRVAGSLSDASGTPWTAEQYADFLRSARSAEASKNYKPVQEEITPINVSDAVRVANRAISPAADNIPAARNVPTDIAARSGVEAGEASIRDPIRQTLKEARSYLASDNLTVTNVEKAFRAKTNIDQMISKAAENGQGATVEALLPMQKALDDALVATSKPYAAARDAYRTASQNIDAIDVGREMTKGRTRVDDNLYRFSSLSPDQQQAARVGYFDPLISRAEDTVGSMTNSARPFVSESARRELPAFAEPGTANQLMNRLGREQKMFETTSQSLGGSKTADNIADMAEMSKFDPGVLSSLMRLDVPGALMSGARQFANEAQGTPPRVIEQLAKALMESDPTAAQALLMGGQNRITNSDQLRAKIVSTLLGTGAAGAGRIAAP